jgi:2-methylisocitrate lyase-like PEP mutase family enzyme
MIQKNKKQESYGKLLRDSLKEARKLKKALAFVGAYDTFSASIIAKYVDTIFLSGYGFAASHYGLPDEGYIAWSDMVDYTARVRHILPDSHILVDIDDGYGDARNLVNAVRRLEQAGASAVMLEDQKRPKQCGHLPGTKELVTLENYSERLLEILDKRKDIFVLARTDAMDLDEGIRRVKKFTECSADAIMIEGIKDIKSITKIRQAIGDDIYIGVNLVKGGKTGSVALDDAHKLGIDLIIYSTPCLFVAHEALEHSLKGFVQGKFSYPSGDSEFSLSENLALLKKNQKTIES